MGKIHKRELAGGQPPVIKLTYLQLRTSINPPSKGMSNSIGGLAMGERIMYTKEVHCAKHYSVNIYRKLIAQVNVYAVSLAHLQQKISLCPRPNHEHHLKEKAHCFINSLSDSVHKSNLGRATKTTKDKISSLTADVLGISSSSCSHLQ